MFERLDRQMCISVRFYAVLYAFANVGAFAVLAVVEAQKGSTTHRMMNGLAQSAPVLAAGNDYFPAIYGRHTANSRLFWQAVSLYSGCRPGIFVAGLCRLRNVHDFRILLFAGSQGYVYRQMGWQQAEYLRHYQSRSCTQCPGHYPYRCMARKAGRANQSSCKYLFALRKLA